MRLVHAEALGRPHGPLGQERPGGPGRIWDEVRAQLDRRDRHRCVHDRVQRGCDRVEQDGADSRVVALWHAQADPSGELRLLGSRARSGPDRTDLDALSAASTRASRTADQVLSSMRPSASRPSDPVKIPAPTRSGMSATAGSDESGTRRAAATRAITPTGRLTRNTQRHDAPTSRPPATGPAAAAGAPVAIVKGVGGMEIAGAAEAQIDGGRQCIERLGARDGSRRFGAAIPAFGSAPVSRHGSPQSGGARGGTRRTAGR